MIRITYIIAGLFSFVAGTGILGTWLRKHPSKANAEKSSRIMHFLFFAGLIAPSTIAGMIPPGFAGLDQKLGLPHLPARRFLFVLGVLLALPGFYLMGVSNLALRKLGSGANAFLLTKRVVSQDIYRLTRNPMSLGFYLLSLASPLLYGSSFALIGALFAYIPAHLFCLKYFEEYELEQRLGESYLEYREQVPFLFPRIRLTPRVKQPPADVGLDMKSG